MKMPDELQRVLESMVNDEAERRLKELTPQVVIDGEAVDHDKVEIEDDLIIITVETFPGRIKSTGEIAREVFRDSVRHKIK